MLGSQAADVRGASQWPHPLRGAAAHLHRHRHPHLHRHRIGSAFMEQWQKQQEQ
jgi:hypothetical protein